VDPIARFAQWLEAARRHAGIIEPTAMCLATADAKGKPSARIVLLKDFDERGFVFYTNLESRKSEELKANPQAALCFHWMPLMRQVRIEGNVEPVSDAEADAYFASRPRESQIGAWASRQSRPMDDRETLAQTVAQYDKQFAGKNVPRPPFWSGWRVIPESIEFWQQGEFRLHERELFTRQGKGWKVITLYP
jgi:pyridoxamine 5'-phosphate oxidase